MKYFLQLLFVAGLFTVAVAQEQKVQEQAAQEETEPPVKDPKMKARIDAARAAYITERLDLTPEQAEKFWPVYKEFSDKRKALRQEFQEAKRSGQKEEVLVDLQLKTRQRELDLEKDYSGRLMKVIPAQKLMNLRSAERDFTHLIVQQIQQRQLQQQRRQEFRDRNQQRVQQQRNN
jgi:hypothetical protein